MDKKNIKFENCRQDNPEIIFIDPFISFRPKNTAGIAYLRGWLEDQGVKTGVINYNHLIKAKEKLKLIDFVKKFLKENNIYSGFEISSLPDQEIFFLLVRIYYFGPGLIWRAVEDCQIFSDLFKASLKDFQNIKYIGISITYSQQVFFSLLIAQYIKRKLNKNIKIIVGGSLVTSSIDDFMRLFKANPIVDYLVVGEGETPLINIINNRKKSDIPNLVYFLNGSYKKTKTQSHHEDFIRQSTPRFEYGDTPFLQFSRKCYWGKCTFCIADNYQFQKEYLTKGVEKIINDIEANNSRLKDWRQRYIFIDSSLPREFIVEFNKKLSVQPAIRNAYYGYLRCERWVNSKILKLARESGFDSFGIGVETFNDRLQKILNKGHDTKHIWSIMKDCHELGIKPFIFFMIGLPTQTEKELISDLDLIEKLFAKYPDGFNVQITPFSVKRGTPLYDQQEKYGIEVVDGSRVFLGGHYGFRQLNEGAISPQAAILCVKDYTEKHLKGHSSKIELWQ